MPRPDLFEIFLTRLNRLGMPYMVTGAVAAIVYGEPRLTHDIDVVLEMGAEGIADLLAAFPLEEFYTPPEETLRTEAGRPSQGHFNIIHHETGFKADVYPMGEDPLHRWAMARRNPVDVHGTTYHIAPPEYVILRKLQYHAEGGAGKHVRDILAMLAVCGDRIDTQEIQRWAGELGLQQAWDALEKRKRGDVLA